MPVIRTLGVVSLCVLAGCGSGEEAPYDAPAADAVTLDTHEAGGCPANPADLPLPCAVGAECRYVDACLQGMKAFTIYVCKQPFEQPLKWYPTSGSCADERRPDGCPLGTPTVSTACETEDKSCTYRLCYSAESGAIFTFDCRSVDGKLIWTVQPRAECTDAG